MQYQQSPHASLMLVATAEASRHCLWYKLLRVSVDAHCSLSALPAGQAAGCNMDIQLQHLVRWGVPAEQPALQRSGTLQLDAHCFAKVADRGVTFHQAG